LIDRKLGSFLIPLQTFLGSLKHSKQSGSVIEKELTLLMDRYLAR